MTSQISLSAFSCFHAFTIRPTTRSTPQKGSDSSIVGLALAGSAFKSSSALHVNPAPKPKRSSFRLVQRANECADAVVELRDHLLLLFFLLQRTDEVLYTVLVLLQFHLQFLVLRAKLARQSLKNKTNRLVLLLQLLRIATSLSLLHFLQNHLGSREHHLNRVHSLLQLLHLLRNIGNRRHRYRFFP